MSSSRILVILRIGLAVLLGGSLLAFVLLAINAPAAGEGSAAAAHSFTSAGSTRRMPLADPPCGTLDGVTIDPMEATGDWYVMTGDSAISATLRTVTGQAGGAVQLQYNLGVTPGAWVQLRRDFSPPLNLSTGDHLRFFYQGTAKNMLEVGLVFSGTNYFATPWKETTHLPWWAYATWDFQDFCPDDQPCPDFGQIDAIFISVVNRDAGVGGSGSFTVDELQYLNVASRTVPVDFEWVTATRTITQQAAQWVGDQQQEGGLLRSWGEEYAATGQDYAWLYDQALGLMVLRESGHITAAGRLASKLHNLQNADGSWYAGYHYLTGAPISTAKPVGAVAWTVYALLRDYLMGGAPTAYQDALQGAAWLASLQRQDGSLPGESRDPPDDGAPTEPNLDVWWAFQATGYLKQAAALGAFLLEEVWHPEIGRFKSSGNAYPSRYQIFLDNQTWGAAFLRALGRDNDARRALSYARWTLAATSSAGSVCGFDGAGPFSVWNEGTLQYVAARGANSQYYWEQMLGQRAADGGLPGSPDNFGGYIVWLTRWHGVAPTSWLYFAGTGGPFHVTRRVSLPLIIR